MVDYTRLAATAQRLITSNGRSISFVKLDEVSADPNKPWNGPGVADTVLPLSGVFVPPNTVRQFGLSSLGEGTEFKDLITYSEQVIIVAQGDNDLRGYTKVVDRSVNWGIIGLQVLRPGDTSLIAFVGVRR